MSHPQLLRLSGLYDQLERMDLSASERQRLDDLRQSQGGILDHFIQVVEQQVTRLRAVLATNRRDQSSHNAGDTAVKPILIEDEDVKDEEIKDEEIKDEESGCENGTQENRQKESHGDILVQSRQRRRTPSESDQIPQPTHAEIVFEQEEDDTDIIPTESHAQAFLEQYEDQLFSMRPTTTTGTSRESSSEPQVAVDGPRKRRRTQDDEDEDQENVPPAGLQPPLKKDRANRRNVPSAPEPSLMERYMTPFTMNETVRATHPHFKITCAMRTRAENRFLHAVGRSVEVMKFGDLFQETQRAFLSTFDGSTERRPESEWRDFEPPNCVALKTRDHASCLRFTEDGVTVACKDCTRAKRVCVRTFEKTPLFLPVDEALRSSEDPREKGYWIYFNPQKDTENATKQKPPHLIPLFCRSATGK